MPPLNRQILRAIFVVIIAMIPLALCAADSDLPPTPAGFKMGMEIELTPHKLANLVHYFDFEKFEEDLTQFAKKTPNLRQQLFADAEGTLRHLSPEMGDLTKDYLRNNPAAFRTLPPELQAELSQGLNLQKVVLEERQQLVAGDGKPLQRQSGLIAPNAPAAPSTAGLQVERPRLILPDAPKGSGQAGVMDAKLFHQSGGVQVPNTYDWEKLLLEWERLPPHIRRKAVRLELLSPQAKAYLFYASLWHPKGFPQPSLRADLSEKEQKFWSKFKWKPDQEAVEFVHKEPVGSPQEFLEDVRAFSRKAQVEREIFDPDLAERSRFVRDREGNILFEGDQPLRKVKSWGSFHYHYSFGNDLTPFAEELNLNLFARRLARGITSDLTGGTFTFSGAVWQKGLMRLVSKNHLEVRDHLEGLDAALKRQFGLLFKMPAKEAAQVLAEDTVKHLNDDLIRKIALSDKAGVLEKIKYPYGPLIEKLEAEVAHSGAQDSVKMLLQLRPKSPALGHYAVDFLNRFDFSGPVPGEVSNLANYWIKDTGEHGQKVRAGVAKLLRSPHPEAVAFALPHLWMSDWPVPPSAAEAAELAHFLGRLHQGEFTGSKWDDNVLYLAKKFYAGDRGFLPVAEKILENSTSASTRQIVAAYLGSSFRGDHELFRRLGPRLLGVKEALSAEELQKLAISKLPALDRRFLEEILLANGKLSPAALADFMAWYKKLAIMNATNIRTAYRVGEFHPELRADALEHIRALAEAGQVWVLDVIAELGVTDPITLKAVKAFGDQGNTELAKKVRSILAMAEAAKAAPKSCAAGFTKVAKRRKGGGA